jgi:hypothetical protein
MGLLKTLIAVLVGLASSANADTLKPTSGREIECIILEQTPERYTIRRGYGLMDVPVAMVQKATRTPSVQVSGATTRPAQAAVTNGSAGRFPIWSSVVDAVTRQPWGKGLAQIPATYIDNGAQKDVPYQSFAVGDYEVNIYGDPDDPACIEVGVYRSLLNDAAAKAGSNYWPAYCRTQSTPQSCEPSTGRRTSSSDTTSLSRSRRRMRQMLMAAGGSRFMTRPNWTPRARLRQRLSRLRWRLRRLRRPNLLRRRLGPLPARRRRNHLFLPPRPSAATIVTMIGRLRICSVGGLVRVPARPHLAEPFMCAGTTERTAHTSVLTRAACRGDKGVAPSK